MTNTTLQLMEIDKEENLCQSKQKEGNDTDQSRN
jgi:hypothetical protein